MLLSLQPAQFLKVSAKATEVQGVQGHEWGKRVVGRAPRAVGAWKKVRWCEGSSGPQLVQLGSDGSVLSAVPAPVVVGGGKKGLVPVHGEGIAKPKELANFQIGKIWTSENDRFAVAPLPPLPGASPWRRWIASWNRSPEKGKSKPHVIEWHLPIFNDSAELSPLPISSNQLDEEIAPDAANGDEEPALGTNTGTLGRDWTVSNEVFADLEAHTATLSAGLISAERNVKSKVVNESLKDERTGTESGADAVDWLWLAVSDDGRSVVGLRADRQLAVWESDELHVCGAASCRRCRLRNRSPVLGDRRVGESELRLPFLNGVWRNIGSADSRASSLNRKLTEGVPEAQAEMALQLSSLPQSLPSQEDGFCARLTDAFPAVRFHSDAIVGRSISVAFATLSGKAAEDGLGSVGGVHCGCCGGVVDVVVTSCHVSPLRRQQSDLLTSQKCAAPQERPYSAISVEFEAEGRDNVDEQGEKDGGEAGSAAETQGGSSAEASAEKLPEELAGGLPDGVTHLELSAKAEAEVCLTAVHAVPESVADIEGVVDGPEWTRADKDHTWTVKRIGDSTGVSVLTVSSTWQLSTASQVLEEATAVDTLAFPPCLGALECHEWRERTNGLLSLEWDPTGDLLAMTVPGGSARGRAGRVLILNHALEIVADVDWEKEVLGLTRMELGTGEGAGTRVGPLQRTASGGEFVTPQTGGVLSPTFRSAAETEAAAGVLFRGVLSPTHEPHAAASGALFSPPASGKATRGTLSPPASQRNAAVPVVCSVAWAPPCGAIVAAVDTAGHVAGLDRIGRVMSLMEGTPTGSNAPVKATLRSFFGRTKASTKDSGGSSNGPQKYLRKEVWTQGLWRPDAAAGSDGSASKPLKWSLSGTVTERDGRGRTKIPGGLSDGQKRSARSTSPFRTLFSLGRSSSSKHSADSGGAVSERYSLCMHPSTSMVAGGASVHLAISNGRHVAVWTVPGIGAEFGAAALMATARGDAIENVVPLHVDKSPAVRAALTWRTAAVTSLGDRCDSKGYYQTALTAAQSELCAALASLAPPDGDTCQRHVRVAAAAMAAAAHLDTRHRTSRPALWLSLEKMVKSLFEAGHLRSALHLCSVVLPVLDATARQPEGRPAASGDVTICRHERTRGAWKLVAHLAQQRSGAERKGRNGGNEADIPERGRQLLALWAAGGPILSNEQQFALEQRELADVIATEALRRAGASSAADPQIIPCNGDGNGNGLSRKVDAQPEAELNLLAAESHAAVSDGDEAFLLGQEDTAAAVYARAGVLGLPRVLAVYVHQCDVRAAVSIMHLAEDFCERAAKRSGQKSDGTRPEAKQRERDSAGSKKKAPLNGKAASDESGNLQEVLEAQCRKHPRVAAAVLASICKEFGLLMAAWSQLVTQGPVSGPTSVLEGQTALAFPSPLSWRGLGFEGRRVRIDLRDFAQGVALFESGGSSTVAENDRLVEEPGVASAAEPCPCPVEAPGEENRAAAATLPDHQTEPVTPFLNPAKTSRRPSFADRLPVRNPGGSIADPAFALAARLVHTGQSKAETGAASKQPRERVRKLERHKFWAIAGAVDWLVKGGALEPAAALLRGAGAWREAAETATELAREFQVRERGAHETFTAAASTILTDALTGAAKRHDVNELAEVLEHADRLLGPTASDMTDQALETLEEWVFSGARALPILDIGRPFARRALDGEANPAAVSEDETAAALRKTLAVLLKVLRPSIRKTLASLDTEPNSDPASEDTRCAGIHTTIEQLEKLAWYLHCRATLSALCANHRGSIHTTGNAPGNHTGSVHTGVNQTGGMAPGALQTLEREVGGWACRLLVCDRYHPAREVQATVVAVCASLRMKEPGVVAFLEQRIPKGRASLSASATLEGMRRMSYTTLVSGRNDDTGTEHSSLPVDGEIDPVQAAFLSQIRKALWESGQDVPDSGHSIAAQRIELPVRKAESDLPRHRKDDVTATSAGSRRVASPVLAALEAKAELGGNESLGSSEESPGPREFSEEKRARTSASSTPLSVLSPTSPRSLNRGLEEGGAAAGDEARGELSQAESCASIAGASKARHVSRDVSSPAEASKKSQPQSMSGDGKSRTEQGEDVPSMEKVLLEKIRDLVVSGGSGHLPKAERTYPLGKVVPSASSKPTANAPEERSQKDNAVQADLSDNPDQNHQTSPYLSAPPGCAKLRDESEPGTRAHNEDGEFERSSGEMYSSGGESAGAAAQLIPEYVRRDRPTVRRSLRKGHHRGSSRSARGRAARSATTQTEEEGTLKKTALRRLVKEEEAKSAAAEAATTERTFGEEPTEDALYVQEKLERREIEHLEATATILAKAGIQENVYLFGTARGAFASQGLEGSGRLRDTLRGTARTFGSATTFRGHLADSAATSGVSGLTVTNRATQALQGTRRTVAFASGSKSRQPPPEADQELLLGLTSHPRGMQETRRALEQGFGGFGGGFRLLTGADANAIGRRLLRTGSAPTADSAANRGRANFLGGFTGPNGLNFGTLRTDIRTAASLGSSSFVALADTVKSGAFAAVRDFQSDVKRRVSWASDEDGFPEAIGRSATLVRTKTRRQGFEKEPRGEQVQRELFRVPSGGSVKQTEWSEAERRVDWAERDAPAERNSLAERNQSGDDQRWGENEEPEVWEHTGSLKEPAPNGVSRTSSVHRGSVRSTENGPRRANRERGFTGENRTKESLPPGRSLPGSRSGQDVHPRTSASGDWVSFERHRNSGVNGSEHEGRQQDNYQARFEGLEEASWRASSAAAAATSGAEAWVQGLVTKPIRRSKKSLRRQSGDDTFTAEKEEFTFTAEKENLAVEDQYEEPQAAVFDELANSTAERRRSDAGGVRLLRRTTTRVAHPTADFSATDNRQFTAQESVGVCSADVRALRDAILMQAASSRQAYEELCDVIKGFAGAGRVFGSDDLSALGTVTGLGFSRAAARGFERGRVSKMMRKLMAKLGDAGLKKNERGVKKGLEKTGRSSGRQESTRGMEMELPVKQERRKAGGDDVARQKALAAAAAHARHLAAAKIQAHVRGYLARRRNARYNLPTSHRTPSPPVHAPADAAHLTDPLSPHSPLVGDESKADAPASACLSSPIRQSPYGGFTESNAALYAASPAASATTRALSPSRKASVKLPATALENETKEQRIFRVLLEDMTATLGEVEAAAASFERDVVESKETMEAIERERWEQKQRYLRAVLGEAHKISAEIDREETEVDAVRGLVAVYENNARQVWE